MALSAQIGYIMPQKYEIYHLGSGNKTNT